MNPKGIHFWLLVLLFSLSCGQVEKDSPAASSLSREGGKKPQTIRKEQTKQLYSKSKWDVPKSPFLQQGFEYGSPSGEESLYVYFRQEGDSLCLFYTCVTGGGEYLNAPSDVFHYAAKFHEKELEGEHIHLKIKDYRENGPLRDRQGYYNLLLTPSPSSNTMGWEIKDDGVNYIVQKARLAATSHKSMDDDFGLWGCDAVSMSKGNGAIYFPDEEHPKDSLIVYGKPSKKANLLGKIYYENTQYKFKRQGVKEAAWMSSTVEYGYEKRSIPFDSITNSGWARIFYACQTDGKLMNLRKGWVKLPSSMSQVYWREHLQDRNLFVIGDSFDFRDGKQGRQWDIELETFPLGDEEIPDYILHPLATKGDWMGADLVTPSDACPADDGTQYRKYRVWLRFMDEDGEPLVWFYPRGC